MFTPPSLDLLNTAILILDHKCKLVYLNDAAEQLVGFSDRQFKGKNLFNLIEADFNEELLLSFIEQEQSRFIEGAHIKTQAGLLICNIMLSCFQQQNQNYILLELQTSQHHSHIQKDLELQQQSRVSNHLIRNLAHEIKNPLGGIKGAAQLLQRKLTEKASDHFSNTYFQIIIQETERLNELVNRLLLPAKPEEKIRVNPHQLIEKALKIVLLQHTAPIEIIKDYDPSLPDLYTAAGQIQQCLLNIIKNAVEALEANGKITLRTRVKHQHSIGNIQYKQVVRIDVTDNGCGIPEDIIKDIFFPTISGKKSNGLGLSIAQSLVQRHGGIIEVESLSQRTTFSLYLPLDENFSSNI